MCSGSNSQKTKWQLQYASNYHSNLGSTLKTTDLNYGSSFLEAGELVVPSSYLDWHKTH